MGRPKIAIDLDHAGRLRAEGKSVQAISEILGVTFGALWNCHLRGEIDFGPKKSPELRIVLDGGDLRSRHESGESILSIANSLSISRQTIASRIEEAGGTIRGASDAGLIRMAREGEEGRQRLVRAAHEARRGSNASFEEKVKRASHRSTSVGHGEAEILAALRERGHAAEPQFPCDIYNIDIALGPIAVELLSAASARIRDPAFVDRAKYLRDRGYCIVLIGFQTDKFIMADNIVGNLNHIIAFLERAYGDPSIRGKNWVIRCGGQRFTGGRNDLGQITAVPSPVAYFHTISEWNFN